MHPTSLNNDWNAVFNNFRDDEGTSGWSLLLKPSGVLHVNVDGPWNDGSLPVPLNEWTHIAMVRSGNSVTRYVNGIADPIKLENVGSVGNVSEGLHIGNCGSEYEHREFTGYIDEVRISKAIARYTGNFTPNTGNHEPDSYTKLLLHMDGGLGSTTFTDSSDSGHTVTANGGVVQTTSP